MYMSPRKSLVEWYFDLLGIVFVWSPMYVIIQRWKSQYIAHRIAFSTSWLVYVLSAQHYSLCFSRKSVGVCCQIATMGADGMYLRDILRYSQ